MKKLYIFILDDDHVIVTFKALGKTVKEAIQAVDASEVGKSTEDDDELQPGDTIDYILNCLDTTIEVTLLTGEWKHIPYSEVESSVI